MSNGWNENSEKLLLFSLIEDPDNCSRARFEQAAKAIGGGVTWNACRQKFYKLKKESEKLLPQGDATINGDAETPAKDTKTTKTPTSKGASGRKRKAADVDGEEVVKTPTKRKRNVKKDAPVEPEAKAEAEGEENPAVKSEDEQSKDE